MAKYQKPDALTTRLVNPLIAMLTKLGLSVRGSHVLAVRGRKTGKMQEVPVNPVEVDGVRYQRPKRCVVLRRKRWSSGFL